MIFTPTSRHYRNALSREGVWEREAIVAEAHRIANGLSRRFSDDTVHVGRHDVTMYTGLAGVALTLLHSSRCGVGKYATVLLLMLQAVHRPGTLAPFEGALGVRPLPISRNLPREVPVATWHTGSAGTWAMEATEALLVGTRIADEAVRALAIEGRDLLAPVSRPRDVADELLTGRAGYLFAVAAASHALGRPAVPHKVTDAIVAQVIADGREGAAERRGGGPGCPLMYTWLDTEYLGAAHGLAGILKVLMLFPEALDKVEGGHADVVASLDWLIAQRLPSSNLPSRAGSHTDELLHWCHGAPGFALTLAAAYEAYGHERYLLSLREAAGLTWSRGLLRRLSLCHGVAGNLYVFLALRRVLLGAAQVAGHVQAGEAEEEAARALARAQAFAMFLLRGTNTPRAQGAPQGGDEPFWVREVAGGRMHGGDRPDSLFEGQAGVAYALLDVLHPDQAAFPGFELPPGKAVGVPHPQVPPEHEEL
jgi:hypothetical protein